MNRTDLAFEAVDNISNKNNIVEETKVLDGIEIRRINILSKDVSNKKEGLYYSIDFSDYDIKEDEEELVVTNAIGDCFIDLFNKYEINKNQLGLVVGLGNKDITPDALGPLVSENLFVTKHIFDMSESINEDLRPVCSIAPGVMGQTGIETYEIIEAVVKKVKPDFLIVIDALASANISRVNSVVQITDTGIHPGSGVGNNRKEISKENLNIPVFALGIPTVVDAASITTDALEKVLKYISNESNKQDNKLRVKSFNKIDYDKVNLPTDQVKENLLGKVGLLSNLETKDFVKDVLNPAGLNMIVTPKDVDESIINLAGMIRKSLDDVLHI